MQKISLFFIHLVGKIISIPFLVIMFFVTVFSVVIVGENGADAIEKWTLAKCDWLTNEK